MAGPNTNDPITDNSLLPFGTTVLAQGDDNEEQFDITSIFENGFNFGGEVFTEISVGTNGGVIFGNDTNVDTGNQIENNTFTIAPFSDDSDARTLPATGANGVTPGVYFDTNTDRDSIVITWNAIGLFNNNITTPNTFQLEIQDLDNGDSRVIFRYFDMQGSNAGFEMGLVGDTIPRMVAEGGNATDPFPTANDLETMPGNTGVAGVWVFDLPDGIPQIDNLLGLTQDGNANGNTLTGTGLHDVLNGLGGNDTIFGRDGIDRLNGGDDDDSIEGEDGQDILHGDAGNDTLRGGNDEDHLFGDEGDDSLLGDGDDDTLDGGAGADKKKNK